MTSQIMNSTRTSSLYRVLTKGELDTSEFVVSIGKSTPPCSTELLVMPIGNGGQICDATQGFNFTTDLPKHGTCVGAYLKIDVVGLVSKSVNRTAGTAAGANDGTGDIDVLHASPIPGLSLIDKIVLKSHSRNLAEINQEALHAMIQTMKEDRRNLTLALAGAGIRSTLSGTANVLGDPFNLTLDAGNTNLASLRTKTTTLYVPILLSAFENKFGYMSSFNETTSLEIQFLPSTRAFMAGSNDTEGHPGVSSAGTSYTASLCVQSKAYRDDVYRQVLAQYRASPSIQSLQWNIEKVGHARHAVSTAIADAVTQYYPLSFDIHTSSSSLSRALIVCISRVSNGSLSTHDKDLVALANTSLGACTPAVIDSVTFSASGREVFKSLTPEMELMSMANKHFTVPGSQLQTCFIHRFSNESALINGDRMSGALSLAGCSSQRFEITGRGHRVLPFASTVDVTKDVGGTFECNIYSVSYNVVSVASSSGAVRNSLSV